jgi:hypothetical protein
MGKIRRLKPWARWFDRDVRTAMARPEEPTQIVDYTDGGLAIAMPVSMVPLWEQMPADRRAAFMADVDRQRAAGISADGPHDWVG